MSETNDCTQIRVCHWQVDDEEMSTWRGGCGVVWYFPDGATPRDSDLRYCPRCGGVVIIAGLPVTDHTTACGVHDDGICDCSYEEDN
jgi:hypothetical protein